MPNIMTMVMMFGIGAIAWNIAWKLARQATVSRPCTESENIAAGEGAKELHNIHQLALKLGTTPGCNPEECDDKATMSLVADPITAACC
jgi:hypothetical protein